MAGRQLARGAALFGAGIVAGGLLLRGPILRLQDASQAQANALRLLDKAPTYAGIGDNRVVLAVQRIEPAVVNIDTVGTARASDEPLPPWMNRPGTLPREVRGKGSGVILTSDGYIVTNNHVIDGARRIRVTLPSGQWYYARLIGHDPQTDLAVVRVEAANLPMAEFGDSDKLQVGEWAVAAGNPLGLGSTITLGVISALNRRNLQLEEGKNLDGAIQTDAAINQGNSGGALANINGQLIGINTAILSQGGGSIGLGFAIPSNTVRRVARDLIATGKTRVVVVRQPWIGIRFAPSRADQPRNLGANGEQGVRVESALPNGPAQRAGLQSGDVIAMVDGKPIGDERDLMEAVRQHRVGDKVVVRVVRNSQPHERDITITAQARPENLSQTP